MPNRMKLMCVFYFVYSLKYFFIKVTVDSDQFLNKTTFKDYLWLYTLNLYIGQVNNTYRKLTRTIYFCRFMNNFGVLGILDRLHGTDNLFRQSKAFERHYVITTLTPVKVLHPEEPKYNKGKLNSKMQWLGLLQKKKKKYVN